MTQQNNTIRDYKCTSCQIVKPLSEFHRDKKLKRGRVARCKTCTNEYTREYNHNNWDRLKEKAEIRRKKNWEKIKQQTYDRIKKNPEVHKARQTVNNALKSGKLIRQSYCSACLNEVKTDGHHPDYSKPLEVVWLCRRCHANEHRRIRAELRTI